DEYWVGFKGDLVRNLVKSNFLSPKNPILKIGIRESVIDLLSEIIEKTKTEKPGYQPLISGAVLHLLGLIHSLIMQESLKKDDVSELVVNKARMILRSNMNQNISIEKVAEELQVSYSWLRKAFKLFTGIAPGQYLLQLKIDHGKKLLSDHTKSIKEIAFELGFESAFYFSKLFKVKTGLSPDLFRKKLRNPINV
ncbi:MAG TPA: AraC family transcriptional regulator, partial [Puia sp.]